MYSRWLNLFIGLFNNISCTVYVYEYVSRMILVRSGRKASPEYKPCWPGKGFSPYRTLYLIYFFWMYTKLIFLPRLNCTLGYIGGPLSRLGYPLEIMCTCHFCVQCGIFFCSLIPLESLKSFQASGLSEEVWKFIGWRLSNGVKNVIDGFL
jgi:hypothetical protein